MALGFEGLGFRVSGIAPLGDLLRRGSSERLLKGIPLKRKKAQSDPFQKHKYLRILFGLRGLGLHRVLTVLGFRLS